MASVACWICAEPLCSGNVRSSEEILGYSGMPISAFVVSLGLGPIARPRDVAGVPGHVCEACSVLVFKLDVIFYDRDRCLEQLKHRFDQGAKRQVIMPLYAPILLMPSHDIWPVEAGIWQAEAVHQVIHPSDRPDNSQLAYSNPEIADGGGQEQGIQDLLPVTGPDLFQPASIAEDHVDVECWSNAGEEDPAHHRSYELEIDPGREGDGWATTVADDYCGDGHAGGGASDLNNISPSIFSNSDQAQDQEVASEDYGGSGPPPSADPAIDVTNDTSGEAGNGTVALPRVELPCGSSRLAQLLASSASDEPALDVDPLSRNPPMTVGRPHFSASSKSKRDRKSGADSILRGLLEHRASPPPPSASLKSCFPVLFSNDSVSPASSTASGSGSGSVASPDDPCPPSSAVVDLKRSYTSLMTVNQDSYEEGSALLMQSGVDENQEHAHGGNGMSDWHFYDGYDYEPSAKLRRYDVMPVGEGGWQVDGDEACSLQSDTLEDLASVGAMVANGLIS